MKNIFYFILISLIIFSLTIHYLGYKTNAFGFNPSVNKSMTSASGTVFENINITYANNSKTLLIHIKNDSGNYNPFGLYIKSNGLTIAYSCNIPIFATRTAQIILGENEGDSIIIAPFCTGNDTQIYGNITQIIFVGIGANPFLYGYETIEPTPINGACGTRATAYEYTDTSYPSAIFCDSGTASPSSPAFPTQGGTTSWQCLGANGGTNASCFAYRGIPPTTPINGACGTRATAYEYTDTSYPAGTFCSAGVASPASPAFPNAGGSTSWQCIGSNGGVSTSCNATRGTEPEILEPVAGSCGTRAGIYSYSDTGYPAGTFCSAGIASPASPAFPNAGGSTSWQCLGLNGGLNSSCTASRGTIPPTSGLCGTNATSYDADATGYAGTFCSAGVASPASPSFPNAGGSTSWQCIGSNGGVNTSCNATRRDTTSWGLDLSGIVNTITNFINQFKTTFLFSFSYSGFNFPNNFNNLFKFNLNTNQYTLNNNTNQCSNMLSISIIGQSSYTIDLWGNLISNSTTGDTRATTQCNIIEGNINNIYSIRASQYPCTVSTRTSDAYATGYFTYYLGLNFNYLKINNNTKIIDYQSSIINNIRWFPFNIIVFGFDISSALNNAVNNIISLFINIILYPINTISGFIGDFGIFFVDMRNIGTNTVCYWGMTWDLFNPNAYSIPTAYRVPNGKFTTNVGIEHFIIFMFLLGFGVKIFRK